MTGAHFNGQSDPRLQAIAEAERAKYHSSKNGGTGQPLWSDVRLSDWAGRLIPRQEWFWEDWIPRQQCVGLYGVTGVLKSTLLLQLLMAGSLGLPFCGRPLAKVPTYGLFCEDTEHEIVRRAHRIAAFYERDLAAFTDFHFASLVGLQDTEFVNFDFGKRVLGPAYHLFADHLSKYEIGFAALDTLPDFFGGDEVNRRQTSNFIRILDGVSMAHNCGIMFAAHPSQRGRASGRLDSGSTGWEGKTRARLTLHDPGDEDDEQSGETPDQRDHRIALNPTHKRILTRAASNYAKPGETIELVIRNGAFFAKAFDPESPPARTGHLRNLEVDAKFIELIGKVKDSGRWVNDAHTHPPRYAPAVFAQHPDRNGITKDEFTGAMPRLLGTGRIRLVQAGRLKKNSHSEFQVV